MQSVKVSNSVKKEAVEIIDMIELFCELDAMRVLIRKEFDKRIKKGVGYHRRAYVARIFKTL